MNKKYSCAIVGQEVLDKIFDDFKHAVEQSEDKFLIVSDLDGTLINDEGLISEETKRVVNILQNAGHIFCLATGRPWRSARHYYDDLKLNSLIANLNGSIISQPYQTQMNSIRFVFSIEILKNLVDEPEIMNFIENIIIEDGSQMRCYRKPSEEDLKLLAEWFHTSFEKYPPIIGFDEFFEKTKILSSILIQIRTCIDIDNLISSIKAKIKTLTCQLWSLSDDAKILEVNSVFANKGNALKFFSSFYGIPLDKTIGFGDGYNDVTLLTKSHYGYAMVNAKTTAKFLSRGVTKFSNNQDGVAQKLVDFFIKRTLKKSFEPWTASPIKRQVSNEEVFHHQSWKIKSKLKK